VYIEHTDAYQVVYHANYFKFLSRGREELLFGRVGEDDSGEDASSGTTTPGGGGAPKGSLQIQTNSKKKKPSSRTDQGKNEARVEGICAAAPVVRADEVVFASSATLGDDILVRSRVIGVDLMENALLFEQVIVDAKDIKKKRFTANVAVAPVDVFGQPCVSLVRGFANQRRALLPRASTVCARDGDASGDDEEAPRKRTGSRSKHWDALATRLDESLEREGDGTPRRFCTSIVAYRDELSRGEFGFCDSDALRFFERNRTEAIGGSGALESLRARGVIVVVSSMTGVRYAPGGMEALFAVRTDDATGETGGETRVERKKYGSRMRTLYSRSSTALKRRGLQIVFSHELAVRENGRSELDAWDASLAVIASAEVTCTCLSAETGRPVRCPEDLAKRFA
jgi:acyl-CoA thioesterase FadM